MFETELIETKREVFEVFTNSHVEPLVYSHLYSEYNENDDIMSRRLSEHYQVYVTYLIGGGQSVDKTKNYIYGMDEAVHE